jgi:predicted metalloprotease with PDZ domain
MLKRFYMVTGLITSLAVGVVVAAGDTGQKEKEKEKAEKEKSKNWVVAGEAPQVFSLPLFAGEGAYLGVYLEEVTAERMKELGLGEERGAVIMKVIEGSPASKAGLKENDVVISYNGRRIDSVREFQRLLGETPADRKVTIEVIRGGSQQTVNATLTRRSPGYTTVAPGFDDKFWKKNEEDMKRAQELLNQQGSIIKQYPKNFGNFAFVSPGEFGLFRGRLHGISAQSLTPQLAEFFGVKAGEGVLISEVDEGSPASKAGLKAGDIITQIDNLKVDEVGDIVTALSIKEEGTVTLKIVRNRSEQTVTVTLEKREQPAPRAPRAKVRTSVVTAI